MFVGLSSWKWAADAEISRIWSVATWIASSFKRPSEMELRLFLLKGEVMSFLLKDLLVRLLVVSLPKDLLVRFYLPYKISSAVIDSS